MKFQTRKVYKSIQNKFTVTSYQSHFT